jgi:RNA polymerase sigma factor (sigma-70 family)
MSREVAVDNELERELVDKSRKGDPTAGPFLISYLGDHLLGYARAIAPDLGDVEREQIVEIAIEAGVRSINRYDPSRGGLRGWFRRQVRWKTSEWWRSGPPPAEQLPDEPVSAPLVEPDDQPILSEVVAEGLRAVIAELPPEDRLLLALRAVEGLGHAEIGMRMNMKTATVRQRYKRLLERLREMSEDQPELVVYLRERGVK